MLSVLGLVAVKFLERRPGGFYGYTAGEMRNAAPTEVDDEQPQPEFAETEGDFRAWDDSGQEP